jgi:hypothetical protein
MKLPFLPLGIPIPAEVEPPTTAWGLTPWGALLLVFIAVMRGWLVPGAQVARIEKQRDEWKTLALQAMDQNQQLLAQGRTVVDVLNAIPAPTPSKDR